MSSPVRPSSVPPLREIRARYGDDTLRVYQAYAPEIARRALAAQTLVAPFKRDRMTWIKPSFTWMMYRAGWGEKPGQEHVLAIEITRSGFEWALAHAAWSHFDADVHRDPEAWRASLEAAPVRIQWDPERSLTLAPLPWRSLQIGLSGEAVGAYVDRWIVGIEDVTPLAREVQARLASGDREGAEACRPSERPYPLARALAAHIGCTDEVV